MRKLYSAINNIDDDLIENAANISIKKVIPFKRYISIAACLAVIFGAVAMFNSTQYPPIDLTERIIVEEFSGSFEIGGAASFDVAVNIEGIITEVSKDGLSFKLDNGKWVYITDETLIGQTCTSVEQKESLLIEPTFRVGNSIAGFTEDENAEKIEAYAIYTNWNWENPIKLQDFCEKANDYTISTAKFCN